MKIGVFDSGLGGLSVARAIRRRLPEYDYLYLGDTKRVPYGGRSQEAIHEFTCEALEFLFAQDCAIVILACNTASAESLRRSQQEFLPARYPDRRVLGVVIPCAEAVAESGATSVGVIGTRSTVQSGIYPLEILSRNPTAKVHALPTPLLVPLIENGGEAYLDIILRDYLAALPPIKALVLGCTHYGVLAPRIREATSAQVFTSEEIVPEKLADYLDRHPEHRSRLSLGQSFQAMVTDLGPGYQELAQAFVGETVPLQRVSL